MLAYTTLSDLFYLPSLTEVIVYLGGLLLVLTLPSLYVSLTKKRKQDNPGSRQSDFRA